MNYSEIQGVEVKPPSQNHPLMKLIENNVEMNVIDNGQKNSADKKVVLKDEYGPVVDEQIQSASNYYLLKLFTTNKYVEVKEASKEIA